MAKQTKRQQETIEKVMHEFKEGDLVSGSGHTVTDRDQAIAIALSEAGVSNRQTGKSKAKATRARRTGARSGRKRQPRAAEPRLAVRPELNPSPCLAGLSPLTPRPGPPAR